jgi:hypothetical protein
MFDILRISTKIGKEDEMGLRKNYILVFLSIFLLYNVAIISYETSVRQIATLGIAIAIILSLIFLAKSLR